MYTNHKDRSPSATIGAIRTILDELGIVTFERRWFEVDGQAFSVRLEADGLWKGCAVNGKGASRELALASAYAEFVERLQNGAFTETSFWAMPDRFAPSDACAMTVAEVCDRFPHSAGLLYTDEAKQLLADRQVPCVPFYDVQSDDVAYLPLGALRATYSSTGMTAGNTPAEAIVQGIGEILERHVINQVSRDAIALPTIPLEMVPEGFSRRVLSSLVAAGYTVHVKDATLGGRFPVIGTLVVAPERGVHHIHFGSDPVFEIALQRSLTEFFQGQEGVDARLKAFPWEGEVRYSKSIEGWAQHLEEPGAVRELRRLAFTKDGSGGLGEQVLHHRPFEPSCFDAFVAERSSNEQMLAHLLRRCEELGGRVLVRDVSFLSFPAFQVHVPRWAEDCVVDQTLAEAELETPELVRIACNLERASVRELRRLADALRGFMQHPALVQGPISRFAPIGATDDGQLTHTLADPDVLLFFLHLRLQEFRTAARHLGRHLGRLSAAGDDDSIGYFRCAAAYMHLRASSASVSICRGTLGALFGEALTEEVLADLDPTKNPFRHQNLMSCGDCRGCRCDGLCGYQEWKGRWDTLLPRMEAAAIDQRRLRAVLRPDAPNAKSAPDGPDGPVAKRRAAKTTRASGRRTGPAS
jgi:ribosomal protein S12 methylthiotransferase accessory factor